MSTVYTDLPFHDVPLLDWCRWWCFDAVYKRNFIVQWDRSSPITHFALGRPTSVFSVRQETNNIFRMSNLRLGLQCNDLLINFWLKGDEKQKLQSTDSVFYASCEWSRIFIAISALQTRAIPWSLEAITVLPEVFASSIDGTRWVAWDKRCVQKSIVFGHMGDITYLTCLLSIATFPTVKPPKTQDSR